MFKPSQEMIQSAKSVFMSMAIVQTIEPIVKGYQKKILEKHQWHIAQEWIEKGSDDRIIEDPSESYLMEDEDFETYLKETNEEREKAGLHVDKVEYCPLLVAQNLQSKAENALIDSMESATTIKAENLYGDNRKKFLDLTLRLLASFVKKERSL